MSTDVSNQYSCFSPLVEELIDTTVEGANALPAKADAKQLGKTASDLSHAFTRAFPDLQVYTDGDIDPTRVQNLQNAMDRISVLLAQSPDQTKEIQQRRKLLEQHRQIFESLRENNHDRVRELITAGLREAGFE